MTRLALACVCLAVSLAGAPGAASAQSADKKPAAEKKTEKKPAAEKKAEKKPERRKPAAEAASSPTAGATLVANFGDWGAYTAQSGRAKICYALSEPKARSPASLKDTKAYLFVSFRPAEKVANEVASVLNFETKEGGAATLAIGPSSYEVVTKGKNAWVKNPADETTAIGAMSKGGTLLLQATSAKGNKTSDRYSLTGFGPALERARRDCP